MRPYLPKEIHDCKKCKNNRSTLEEFISKNTATTVTAFEFLCMYESVAFYSH